MDLRDDIKQNASHWIIVCHHGWPKWREVKLMSNDGRVLWHKETPRYLKGSEDLCFRKAKTRAETIITNFESGYQIPHRLKRTEA